MNQPFCSPVQALRSVLDAAALLPSPSPETIPLEAACGRIAAADLCARMDQPPFDRSPLDGYALHSADTAGASRETPVTLPVVMKLYAGDAPAAALPAGCAARIMTGAPLPEGADCVLMQELTDSGEETVQLYAAVKPLQNVVFRGEDVAAGAVIASAGTVLTPAHLGVLAGQGYAEVTVCRPLTVTGGIVTVKNGDKDVTDTLTVTTDAATGKKTYSVPDGATVTVTLDKTLIPEGMVFDIWSTGKFSLPLGQDYKAESITFPMSSDVVDIAAQYRDATIEDDGPNVLGTAAIIGTAAVGTAVLGYQAYSLGAEFAGKLMALPYFPSNRSALAMMLWEDAGKPMPESELLYPDVGQEEQDMDLQHAARWAMENELIPDLNDEGTAPEEMKFYPDNAVSKIDVLKAWQKAQELKQNA